MVKLLETLTQTPGIPGREEKIAQLVQEEMNKFCDSVKVDAMGNVIGYKQGTGKLGKSPKGRIMLAGHMDEIGFVVKHIDKDGFIRIHPLGGFDARTLMGQKVTVHGKQPLPGNLALATKPIHVLTEEEKKKPPKIKDYFIDVGLPADEVKEHVQIGDMVTLERAFSQVGNTYTSKALDDRVGVYLMLEAVKRLSEHQADLYLVATTQEEVGLRGALTSAYGVEPHVGIALDVTIAADTPGSEEAEQITKLGEGAAIKLLDSASISNYRLVQKFRDMAEQKNIAYQMEILSRGGTDAGSIQMTRAGVPVITLSVPCRYVHSVNEMIHRDDLEASVKLLSSFLEEGDLAEFFTG